MPPSPEHQEALPGRQLTVLDHAATMASPPRLFMLTRNAISDIDWANPAHAVLWGLGRALALEHPDIWGGIVDLDDSVPAEADNHGGTDDAATMPAGEIKEVWRTCEPEQRRTLLRNHVGVLVAAVMGLPSSQSLNPSTDFFELGMDSLMSVILQRALAETLGELLPQSVVFDEQFDVIAAFRGGQASAVAQGRNCGLSGLEVRCDRPQCVLATEGVIGKHNVDVDREPRHVVQEQVERRATLECETRRLEHGGSYRQQQSDGVNVFLVHERLKSRRSPDFATATQRFPPPIR